MTERECVEERKKDRDRDRERERERERELKRESNGLKKRDLKDERLK